MLLHELDHFPLADFFRLHGVVKHGSFLVDRSEVDMAVKVLHDHFADHESKSDAVCINLLLFVLVGAEEHEHVLVVGLLDALSAVFDGDADLLRLA